jgi:hypothetical protein
VVTTVSAALVEDVAEVTVREDTAAVMLVKEARKVALQASSLQLSVVVSVVVAALLHLPRKKMDSLRKPNKVLHGRIPAYAQPATCPAVSRRRQSQRTKMPDSTGRPNAVHIWI